MVIGSVLGSVLGGAKATSWEKDGDSHPGATQTRGLLLQLSYLDPGTLHTAIVHIIYSLWSEIVATLFLQPVDW